MSATMFFRAPGASLFLQFASDKPFLPADFEKQHSAIVSEPKKFQIENSPQAQNLRD